MKIAIMSDLHLEFDSIEAHKTRLLVPGPSPFEFYFSPPQPDADVLVLAGDIWTGTYGMDWASRKFRIPTVMIGGNHEPYEGDELLGLIAESRRKATEMTRPVIFLEQESWAYTTPAGEAVRFIGATLWTDFELNGDPKGSMNAAARQINDFRLISICDQVGRRRLIPEDTVRLHKSARAFIEAELTKPFDGKTVVVSHHAPSAKSQHPKYVGSLFNPAFASNLEDLIERHQPDLWIHGHVHDSFDYRIGRTRVICNPRGYFERELNPGFDPTLVVEI